MNTITVVEEIRRDCELLRLLGEAQALAGRGRNARKQLAILESCASRVRLQQRMLEEAALTELLWQYLDHVEGPDTGYVVRQLIADIAARG